MRPLPQWLQEKAAAARRVRLDQRPLSSEEARAQFERAAHGRALKTPLPNLVRVSRRPVGPVDGQAATSAAAVDPMPAAVPQTPQP